MRREDHLRLGQTGMLQNFWSVAVGKQVVGTKVFIDFHKMQIAARIFAGTCYARFTVADNTLRRGDQPRGSEWFKSEDGAGGVATGIGNELCRSNLRRIKFRQTIDSFTETRSMGRGQFVPVRKCVGRGKPESTTKINDPKSSVQKLR